MGQLTLLSLGCFELPQVLKVDFKFIFCLNLKFYHQLFLLLPKYPEIRIGLFYLILIGDPTKN